MTDGEYVMHERSDDPEQVAPEDVEEFLANLPALARQVERNRVNGHRSDRRLAFLFIFVTLIGLVGGVLLQRQAAAIQASTDADRHTLQVTRDAAFDQCQLVNDNARALNRFLDVAVASVKANMALTPADKEYRVSLYTSIKQTLPVCDAP